MQTELETQIGRDGSVSRLGGLGKVTHDMFRKSDAPRA